MKLQDTFKCICIVVQHKTQQWINMHVVLLKMLHAPFFMCFSALMQHMLTHEIMHGHRRQ